MKKYFRNTMKLIFVLFSVSFYSQCPAGDVIISSQNELNDFISNYPNCTEINGDLIIKNTDIISLEELPNLQDIQGTFKLENNNSLINIGNIYKASGVEILDNDALQNIVLFIDNSNGYSLNERLEIKNNDSLKNIVFNGLTNYQSEFSNNNSLETIIFLEEAFSGNITIKDNPVLIDVEGLDEFIQLKVSNNSKLKEITTPNDFDADNDLQNINNVNILNNPNLETIPTISHLSTLQEINITNNPKLDYDINFEGLQSIESLSLENNNVTNLNLEFPNLNNVGNININEPTANNVNISMPLVSTINYLQFHNLKIETLNLSNLTLINSGFYFTNNIFLETLNLNLDIEKMGRFKCINNENLQSIVFPNLYKIDTNFDFPISINYSFNISENNALEEISFPILNSVYVPMYINGSALEILNLPILKSVINLNINNTNLSSLNLQSLLITIGSYNTLSDEFSHDIQIQNNDNLKSVYLDNLVINSSLLFINNSVLEDVFVSCNIVTDLYENEIENDIIIVNNFKDFNAEYFCSDLNISVEDKSNLFIYPNPIKNTLFIENISEVNTIQIQDLSGKLIVQKSNSNSINVSDLTKGVYIIKIFEENKKYTFHKFLKQ
ncbi:T9SS type A sorting domain-containing protein [Aureivirga sp. CE67]|uniref:T9SS type A sorting domain-containing protein n=1 Tax=Aureivirga sp. CE67 TaxID=1788983 RepID=UPI0018CA5E6E|nr:T9SS type A sorting domain-containing protein [Aureivirga sp. CE67]